MILTSDEANQLAVFQKKWRRWSADKFRRGKVTKLTVCAGTYANDPALKDYEMIRSLC
jgi:hypothetical protein